MAKLTLIDIASGYASIQAINSNNTLIEAAIENTLSRDGSTPNSMSADLDMSNQAIINLPAPLTNNSPARLQDVLDASSSLVSTTAVATSLADSGGNYAATNVEAALAELSSDLVNEGSSIIGFFDAGGYYLSGNVEDALGELGGTSGAGIIGLLDSGANYTATDVEGALTELASVATGEGASIIGIEDSAGNFTATNVEDALAENVARIGTLNTLVFDIGDWDMSTATGTASVNVAHGLTYTKIRSVSAMIRNDADLTYTEFLMDDSNHTTDHYIQVNSTNITLVRGASSRFDNTNFDATTYNRGWVIVQYID